MRRVICRVVFLCMLSAVMAGGAHARTWLIQPDGSGDAPTIQAGVDSTVDGDVVVLASGTFTGPGNFNVDFGQQAITIRGALAGNPGSAVVDCEGRGRGFIFNRGEDATSVLENITVRNGRANFQGGAIFCRSSSPTIRGNIFENNFAARQGGAIYCDSLLSAAFIQNNVFRENTSGQSGGGLWISGLSTVVVEGNEFARNGAMDNGGGLACDASTPVISRNRFTDNRAPLGGGMDITDGSSPVVYENDFDSNQAEYGGGIRCERSSPCIERNTFENNVAGTAGGGIYCENASPDILRNTFDGNTALAGGAGIHCVDFSIPRITNNIIANSPAGNAVEADLFSQPDIVCCDFFNNAGGNELPPGADSGGNISLDPEFCGVNGSGNFYLQADSPCVDCNSQPIGRFGVGCKIVSVEVKSWGALKLLYQEGR
ncbi:MAG: right-handed parallel beta-helix repeat-containing protein [Candidatus Krumholzibacteriota bacterium]|nr:right-handed parallel beta-helix repeat-containing protein [Candidatus Krumholzibacteriota bacterium]